MTIEDFLIHNNAELNANWKNFSNLEEKQNFVNKLVVNLQQQLSSQIKSFGLKIFAEELATKIASEVGETIVNFDHKQINFNSISNNALIACENKLLLQLVVKNLKENGLACLEKQDSIIYPYLIKQENFNLDANMFINRFKFFDALQQGNSNLEKTHLDIKNQMEGIKQKIEELDNVQTRQNKNESFNEMKDFVKKIEYLENECKLTKKKLDEAFLKLKIYSLTKGEMKNLKNSIKFLKNELKAQNKLLNSYKAELNKFKDFNFVDDKILEDEKQNLIQELEKLRLVRNRFKTYIDFARQICRQNSFEHNM